MSLESSQPVKIFLIGFNKCGTTSLHAFFERNGIASLHWGHNHLATQIYSNKQLARPLLMGIDHYTAYSDMEAVMGKGSHPRKLLFAHQEFRLIDQQYPGSLFILNTRNREDWIQSRLRHAQGLYARVFLRKLQLMAGTPEITMDQMINGWRREWDQHHSAVEHHFQSSDLYLRFHIQLDEPVQLSSFLTAHGIPIMDSTIPHNPGIGNWVIRARNSL